jgi:hypothetical protein
MRISRMKWWGPCEEFVNKCHVWSKIKTKMLFRYTIKIWWSYVELMMHPLQTTKSHYSILPNFIIRTISIHVNKHSTIQCASSSRPSFFEPLKHRFQPHNCGTCENKHPWRKRWIENQVVCSNCGGYHPTNWCNKPDKVNPLKTTKWNFFKGLMV